MPIGRLPGRMQLGRNEDRPSRVISRASTSALLLALAGCAAPPPPEPARPSPTLEASAPSTASAAVEMQEDVLLLRAWSGPWEDPAERTEMVAADVVLYRDGLVVADVSQVWGVTELRAIRLRPDELEALLDRIVESEPAPIDRASSLNSACSDAGAQVIHVRVDGSPVELAVYCLVTMIPIIPHGTPEPAVELSRMLDELEQLAAERPAADIPAMTPDPPGPVVPVAPHTGG